MCESHATCMRLDSYVLYMTNACTWFRVCLVFCVLIDVLHDADMMESSQKQRLEHLLVETIQVLCKNSLPDESSFCIEATIGITLSSDHAMVISFKERIKSDGSHLSLMIADEQAHKQQPDNITTETKKHHNLSHSSCSRDDNYVERLVGENPAVREHVEVPQTHNGNGTTDQEVSLLVNNFDDGMMSSHHASFEDTRISPVNCYSLPTIDNCYTFAQSSADHAGRSTDDVVIFKVESGNDTADTVAGMHQFGTEVAAPSVRSCLNVRKRKRPQVLPHERFDGHTMQSQPGQTSSYIENNNLEMQHIDGSHQQPAAFDASSLCVKFSCREFP